MIGARAVAASSLGGGGWGWIALVALLAAVRLASSRAAGRLAIDAGAVLRERLMHGLLRLDTEPLRAEGIGRLMGRVADVEAVESLALGGGLTAASGSSSSPPASASSRSAWRRSASWPSLRLGDSLPDALAVRV